MKLEQSSVTVSLGGSSVNSVPRRSPGGPLVKLGSATLPVLHAADFGVGGLGAAVLITPTQIRVLA